jgi:uncharacterized membrane protein
MQFLPFPLRSAANPCRGPAAVPPWCMDIGTAHVAFALLAIASGAWVLLRRKGDAAHRWRGWVYVGSMVGLNITALLVYDLTGSFGPFHAMAIASLVGVLIGVVYVRRRRPPNRWRYLHATWMSWSYVGLLAAAAAEVATRLPESPFWWMVLVASGAVMAVGGLLIARLLPRALEPRTRRVVGETP